MFGGPPSPGAPPPPPPTLSQVLPSAQQQQAAAAAAAGSMGFNQTVRSSPQGAFAPAVAKAGLKQTLGG